MRHDRRLGIFGEPELLVRPFPHQAEEMLPERLVNLREHIARGAARLGERGAHSDRLAALTREKKSAHARPCCYSDRRAA